MLRYTSDGMYPNVKIRYELEWGNQRSFADNCFGVWDRSRCRKSARFVRSSLCGEINAQHYTAYPQGRQWSDSLDQLVVTINARTAEYFMARGYIFVQADFAYCIGTTIDLEMCGLKRWRPFMHISLRFIVYHGGKNVPTVLTNRGELASGTYSCGSISSS